MPQAKVIFDGQHYTACTLSGGLVVTRKRKQGGISLIGDQAATWIDAIETAIDASEANALCRAILEG
jgi:hypothetical protein